MDIPELPLVNQKGQTLVLVVKKNMPVLDVIHQMNQAGTSCALILESEKLVGIFTEKNLFQVMFTKQEELDVLANRTALTQVTVGEFMTQPVITLSQTDAEDLPPVVQIFSQHDISHLPILDSRGKVISVVTCLEVMERLTAALAQEVAQRQHMSDLLVQKEASYQASQARINDIVDSAIATAIVSFRVFPNRDWEYDYHSVGCEAVFGYTPQEISRDKYLWMSRVHPEDRETVIMPLFDDIFAERTVTVEYRFQHTDGSLRWISGTYTSRYDAAANCWIVTATSTDITDRKQIEEALRESEERWHLAIAGTNEAIWDWNIITNQTFRSARWFEMLGYEREQLSNTDDEWHIRIHPDDYEAVIAAQQAYLQRQVPDYHVEYRLRRQDGSYGWFRSRAKAVWDEQGNPVRLVGSLGDVSDVYDELHLRKQAELALQEREAMLRRIGDNLPNGAIYKVTRELDGSNCFSYLSAGFERLMEIKVEDALRDSSLLYSQLLPEDIPRFQAAADESRANLSVFDIQLRFRTPSGQFKWLHFRSTPRYLEDGRVAWDGLVVDVTNFKHTEETLRQNEEQLRLTLEFNHIGAWDWNLQTGEVIWNDNTFRLMGLEPRKSEMDYQLWRNCVHPEDIDRVEQAVFKALREHTNFEAEYRIVYPDGRVRWITGKGRAIYNEAGEPVRMLGVMIDISDVYEELRLRKLAEQALQEKETFLRSIYNGVGQAIFVVDVVDNDFRLVNLNPTGERISGLSSQELPGKTLEQIFPPTVVAAIRQHYQDCITARESITYEECLPFNGKETWWVTSLTPLIDENSRIYRIVGNSVNISDRKHAEHILELQAVITRNMAEGICLVRASDGIMVYANPKFEQMFGYETGELIGQHVSIVNYANEHITAEEVNQAIRSAILQDGEATYEVHNVKKDGTPFWSRATASVFEHPEYGTVLVAVQQDITEHKQAEEKIKASLTEKEVLLKEIHHRVKNNLGIVSSLLQMQCRRTQDSQAIAILRDSQNRIASIALVHEKLYRSEDLANIDFAEYLPDLTTHLFDSYNIRSDSVQLNIQVENVSLDIETAIPCGLIINELVSNALKYAFPDNRPGKIQLHLYQEVKFSLDKQHNLILIVRDNGVGLPTDFERNQTKTLGITLVYGLVKQLKGCIEIHSQQGTEFKITFSKNRA
ncbi:two-component sensor histidine kinase [Calothrix sp. NIES-2100]|uniref:PAS domain-containing protein n=1 Tax=Calothrix sp. NIES-2100 TaxID=1954172 RepID=UPI000B5F501F|nr:two-component sensor histidine kinase [Calothrix sp. NIES-2100]